MGERGTVFNMCLVRFPKVVIASAIPTSNSPLTHLTAGARHTIPPMIANPMIQMRIPESEMTGPATTGVSTAPSNDYKFPASIPPTRSSPYCDIGPPESDVDQTSSKLQPYARHPIAPEPGVP